MVFDNFRRKLRQEALLWWDEGVIDALQYKHLAERYQFHQQEIAQSDRFVFILIAVGCILSGLGIITFVAANWQIWSKTIKFTLLLILFLAINITGFSLWKQPNQLSIVGKQPRHKNQSLGNGLLMLGALILGANIALSAQIFHMSISDCEIFLCWGFTVLFMAYSLRLASLGTLGIILIQIGYWTGLSAGELQNHFIWAHLVVKHMPLLSAIIFIPLAYRCKSQWIFTLGAIALVTSLQFNLKSWEFIQYSDSLAWIPAIAFTLPPALLWSYDDLLFPRINIRDFQPISRMLALIFFSILFYFLSFHWWWKFSPQNASLINSYSILDVIFLCSLAAWQWYYLLTLKSKHRRTIEPSTIVFAGCICITGFISFWHQNISPIPNIAVFVFNLLLAIFALGIIRLALTAGEKSAFWGGIVLLALQITSRLLEYNTDLLLKSSVFLGCGIGVIIAGVWFEQQFFRDT
ncbi:hypothetical protein NIES4106_04850 [Fischerella sp. NIES-4106]|nr:hypothetical protein NIES4106_04850 [Fischerella sp. NIES-4106]